jgi:two-component system response regulator CpxR
MDGRLLMVDDDRELCALMREYLESQGFQAEFAYDGPGGLNRALCQPPDLVILDLMLPGMDGFRVLKRLRETTSIPVLMLTARGEETDRIYGLERGADDYLSKPFNPRELMARIRAILRRTQAEPKEHQGRIEVEGVVLDARARTVHYRGELVPTTSLEFEILDTLMRAAGHVVSRDRLTEVIYNRKAGPYDRSIDMHVSHLRRKLSPHDDLIMTVRGTGYQFRRSE